MILQTKQLKSNFDLNASYVCVVALILALVIPDFGYTQSYLDKDSVLHNPRIYLGVGGYSVDLQTRLRLDSDIGLGTEISLEDDLKLLNEGFVFRADAIARVKRRSQFAFSYTSILRRRNKEIDQDISFLDTTFYVGADIKFFFDTYYYALSWRYSLLEKPNWNAGFSVGLRVIQFKTGMEATINGNEYGEETSVAAPAILLGLHGSAYLTPRLLGRYSFEYFQLSIDDINIRILETRASLEYFIIKNVGLGVAYSTNEYLVKDIPFNNDFKGRVTFDFGGFSVLASARF